MKRVYCMALAAMMGIGAYAQSMQMEEYFDYADRVGTPLITDTVAKSDNFDGVTGWSTQANNAAGATRFYIAEDPLEYEGYVGSGIGNALQFRPEEKAGQAVFKPYAHGTKNDSTIYIAFLIRFEDNGQDCTGSDYFWGMKLENKADDSNFGARIFAKVEHEINGHSMKGEEISMGIVKNSGGSTTWVTNDGPFLTFDETYLFVVKYHVGVLNGATADEEAGHYDDEMWLYINPTIGTEAENKPALYNADPNCKDFWRLTSKGTEMGSARTIYLRSGDAGSMPQYTIDGIRAANTWEEVLPIQEGLSSIEETHVKAIKTIRNGQIIITRGEKTYSVLGTEL